MTLNVHWLQTLTCHLQCGCKVIAHLSHMEIRLHSIPSVIPQATYSQNILFQVNPFLPSFLAFLAIFHAILCLSLPRLTLVGIYQVPLCWLQPAGYRQEVRGLEDSGQRIYSLSSPMGCGWQLTAFLRFVWPSSLARVPAPFQALAASAIVGISSSPSPGVCNGVNNGFSCCLHQDGSPRFVGFPALCPYHCECCYYLQSFL